MTRLRILVAAVALCAGRAFGQPETTKPPPDAFPGQDPTTVREIVGASHRDIDRVGALLKEAPQLANATYDWGFGDWETALGAASHTGRYLQQILSSGRLLQTVSR